VVQQGYHKGKHRCQFSWFCDGLSDRPREQVAWARSLLIADDVMRGEVPDPTKGATHYHANYVKPYWAKHLTYNVTYGSHRFYE
jgi:N-acetylmuramoyl-L-alanine amidase